VRARGPRRRKEFVFEEMMSHSHIQAKGEQERARGTQDKNHEICFRIITICKQEEEKEEIHI
jgi:hypothetical protein